MTKWTVRFVVLCGFLLASFAATARFETAAASTIYVTFEGKVRVVDGLPYAVDDVVQKSDGVVMIVVGTLAVLGHLIRDAFRK